MRIISKREADHIQMDYERENDHGTPCSECATYCMQVVHSDGRLDLHFGRVFLIRRIAQISVDHQVRVEDVE